MKEIAAYVVITSIKQFGMQLLVRNCCANVEWIMKGTDTYAIAVIKNDNIIDHLPRKISHTCSLFIRRGGNIACQISGTKTYSVDLPQEMA